MLGNCSEIKALPPRYSKRMMRRVYHTTLWRTTTCTMREAEKSPYMDLRRGIPTTSVLGRVEREKRVMAQSPLPPKKARQRKRRMRMTNFWRVSAAMKPKFMVYGSLDEMKWKERTGTANTATKRLIPEHWSGVKIFHHFTEP